MDIPEDVSHLTASVKAGGSSPESDALPRQVDIFSEYAHAAIELKIKELRRFPLKCCPLPHV